MKAQKRRIPLAMAVIVSAAAMLGVLLGAGLYAAACGNSDTAALPDEYALTEISVTVENPLYAGVTPSDAQLFSSGATRLSVGGTLYSEHRAETYNSSSDTVAAEIRAAMVARSETIKVTFETSSPLADSALSDFVDEALEETGEGNEGDYLRWGYSEYSCSGSYSSSGSKYTYVLTYTFSYYTNASEEAAVTKKISQVLSGFGFTSSTTDYEKISAIYDYICENVTYDYDGLNDDSDVLKYTAYGALIEGSAVCQGYSTLFYRMLMESGISSRVIAGVSYGDNHAWNIALLGGYYYNLDSTWDASASSYKYFLKCDANFSNHTRNSEYLTSAFYSLYPMASSDYTVSGDTTYTVTFDSNGGSSVSSQTVKSGSTATEPTSPTRSGYTFDGWYTSSSGGSKYSFSTAITSNLTLYAHWTANTVSTYTVTFNSNGGSSVSSQTVSSGSTAAEPTSPTKTGYTFDGWYTSSSGGSKYSFSTAVTSNLTLYAHWTINTYTVTFNSNGGSSVSSQTVNYGSTATQPTSPTKSGYTFDGWYTSSSGGSKYSFSTAVTSNLTLYAHWTASSGGTSTTSSTDTTTAAPDETTTAAPDETTAAPDETTAAPDETTAAETTEASDVTTADGGNTTDNTETAETDETNVTDITDVASETDETEGGTGEDSDDGSGDATDGESATTGDGNGNGSSSSGCSSTLTVSVVLALAAAACCAVAARRKK